MEFSLNTGTYSFKLHLSKFAVCQFLDFLTKAIGDTKFETQAISGRILGCDRTCQQYM